MSHLKGHLQPGALGRNRASAHSDVGPVRGAKYLRTSLSLKASTCRALLRASAWRTSALKAFLSFFSFVDVNRAACVSVEARVEETGRILPETRPWRR